MDVSRSSRGLATGLVVLALTGCWAGRYDERLEGTGKWYAHLERLDRHLVSPAWKNGTILYFRPPIGFEPQFDTEPSPKPNPSMPDFTSWQAEGLQGVWKADLPITGGPEGAKNTAPAYLVVADNFALWTNRNETKRRTAEQFKGRFGRALANEFGLRESNIESWGELRLPRAESYGTSRSLRTLEVDKLPAPIGGHEYEMHAFAAVTGNVQAAAFYLIPVDARNKPRLLEAIGLSIDTFEVSTKTPKLVDESTAEGTKGGGANDGF